jgi:glycosyltransferase involved in cell wall biosynthesis
MRWLHLYRPRLPGSRAQSIQTLRTCHALASLGHEVTILADRGPGPNPVAGMGIDVPPNLHLKRAPIRHPGLAGLWFRWNLKRWWNGSPGVIIARDKRRLLTAIEQYGLREHRLVLETHELDSQISTDQRNDWFAIEQQCLAHADALVANCGGTLAAWKTHHEFQNQSMGVVHNATHINDENIEPPRVPPHILILGSMRPNKGVQFILNTAPRLPCPLHWVGGTAAERADADNSGHVVLKPPVAHEDIATTLGKASVLLLPLGENPFSQIYTSPLKLWDYLATNKPIVAANTPAIMEISRLTGASFHLYKPEDEQSLQQAVRSALQAAPRSPYKRPWMDRAQELVDIVEAIP